MKWIPALFITMSLMILMLPSGMGQGLLPSSGSDTIPHVDPAYVEVYRDELTARAIITRNQTALHLGMQPWKPSVRYKSNDQMMTGVGLTYSFLTLNVAARLPFLNRDDADFGISKSINLQAHTLFRKYIVDLYLQRTKGFYLANPGYLYAQWTQDMGYPLRGDLRVSTMGANVQYLFNSNRFSYKASFVQNELQKRSAGSPLAGVEAFWILAMADSSLVPADVPVSPFQHHISYDQVEKIGMGLNGGYAYTFVWNKALFISLSSSLGVSTGYQYLHSSSGSFTLQDQWSMGVSNHSRIALGVNSARYYVGLSYLFYGISSKVIGDLDWINRQTSQVRFHVVRRFRLNRSIRALRPDLWEL